MYTHHKQFIGLTHFHFRLDKFDLSKTSSALMLALRNLIEVCRNHDSIIYINMNCSVKDFKNLDDNY